MSADGDGILIVEDETEIRNLLTMLFELEGFTVYQAVDGEHALEVFQEDKDNIVLMITDLGLPRLGGVELITKLRAIKPSIKIIGSSGYGRQNVREEVLNAGGDLFVPKPFVADELMETVRKLLGRS
jgi:two-component system cell cycle sensor histidine kinase/response regulator CckA